MANMKSEEELAELEKLSANYVPEQKVPPALIRDRMTWLTGNREISSEGKSRAIC